MDILAVAPSSELRAVAGNVAASSFPDSRDGEECVDVVPPSVKGAERWSASSGAESAAFDLPESIALVRGDDGRWYKGVDGEEFVVRSYRTASAAFCRLSASLVAWAE